MPDASQLESFTAGVETAVDVAHIERQLGQLWRLAGPQITRASLFNLVVFCPSEAARAHATEAIRALIARHPCRAIVLWAQPGSSRSRLRASIAAHCHRAGGGAKQVCCEQILIEACGQSVADLPGAVLPLLESDLPTVLWWQGNFLEQPQLFGRLCAVAGRVVFDSSAWPAAETQLGRLRQAIAARSPTAFADLSWTRLGLWRKLTADCFDPPQCRAALEEIHSVAVTHGRGPGARLRALLYGSWLAAQLGWTADEAATRIRLAAKDDDDATAVGILLIEIKTHAGAFVLRKDHGERTASATADLPGACAWPRKRAFLPADDVSLLSRELDPRGRHSVYERALDMAAQLLIAKSARRR